MNITVRTTNKDDVAAITELLGQVLLVHHNIRPDLFLREGAKYTPSELETILTDPDNPVFVAVNEDDEILGHCFCQINHVSGPNLVEHDYLYIDDLCINEKYRGQGVGRILYNHVVEYAKVNNCARLSLHVWEGNDPARAFYDSMGFKPAFTSMDYIL